jgi:hypothetical protein
MTDSPKRPAPASPFDPYVRPFLAELGRLPEGYAPVAGRDAVAAALDWEPAFAEAVFTSARARGLVEPVWGRGPRNRNRWRVSRKGRRWLAEAMAEGQPEAGERPPAT